MPNRPLRVGFDGRALSSPAGGVRRYTRQLVAALAESGAPVEMVALGGGPPGIPGVQHRPEPRHPPTNLGWTLVGLPGAARGAALDVYHGPAYTAPPWGLRPLVLTIHDVSYARRPEWYPYRRDAVRRMFYRASARAATVILTDSEFSRQEILAAYRFTEGRIEVVPLGVDREFRPGPIEPDPVPDPEVSALSRGRPFVLHVGDLHPRRRLELALDAVVEARRRPDLRDLVLVLAGTDRGVAGALRQRAEAAGAVDALVLSGPVDESTLLRLYQRARALVYPSAYEGFGLPMLEAMACGAPVIAARAAAAAEVAGNAALLVEGDAGRPWAEALVAVLTDPERAAAMRAAGLSRAAAFTWSRTAALTYEVYRRTAARA
jgi:glycosyltransferase involved in cell wall biosynthesis